MTDAAEIYIVNIQSLNFWYLQSMMLVATDKAGFTSVGTSLKAKIHVLENSDAESKIGRMVMNAVT